MRKKERKKKESKNINEKKGIDKEHEKMIKPSKKDIYLTIITTVLVGIGFYFK